MFKSNGGFTLVELIVVIAILAILAGVAVPAYSGYIAKANDAAVLSELSAIHTAAQAACAMEGSSVSEITVPVTGDIIVTAADSSVSITAEELGVFYTRSDNLGSLISKHSKDVDSATWDTTNGWNLIDND